MPVDDDLGDIVTPDIRWDYPQAGSPTGIVAQPTIRRDEPELEATNTPRRQRARGLIAVSVIAITLAGIAYLYPSWAAKSPTPLLKAAPTPITASTTIGPLVRTFTSPTMQFSVRYPAAWKAKPSTTSWRTKGARWTDPEADLLDGGLVNFWGTSQALELGQSPKAWLDRYAATAWSGCSVPNDWVPIGDQIGVIDYNGCPSTPLVGQYFDLVLVVGRRGYDFETEGAGDRAFFLSMLKTVTFGSKPPPEPIPTFSQAFTSDTMRYSIKYPAGWLATPATQPWQGEWGNWGFLDTDHLDGGFVAFWASSEPLARGQSAASWIHQYLASVGTAKCGLQENVAVAGHAGLIIMNGCNSDDLPGHVYDVVFVAGRRAYDLSMEGEVDHAYFLAMLATVKLQS